ncbi:LmbU family transcriptional regulator [Saccharothrix algeriensis]|uniref:LmbU n=2 Tax=Saccharothrix algeriensis TaxID=173560 RepID=A0ABS2S583_9PSEU|nr:LmbU family transcriptional regulator [Saccharothrix algeriensis]MBM7811069.1 hypothetical protein [Saccharothrix algeriensis]
MNTGKTPEEVRTSPADQEATDGPGRELRAAWEASAEAWRASLLPDLHFVDGVRVRSNGLMLPRGMSFDAWQRIGRHVLNAAESTSWWIGDLLVYGQHAYGDRYEQAIARTSLDYQTLRNYAWIAKKFPLSRRRDKLSFGHHTEVAALTDEEQDTWLLRAERLGWSRNELRRRLRAARIAGSRATAAPRPDLVQSVKLQVSVQQHDRWRAAAEMTNQAMDDWIIETLDEAAGGEFPVLHGPGGEPAGEDQPEQG